MYKILGETLSLVSSLLETYERGVKTYKKSLRTGIVRYIIQAIAYLFLAGVNGTAIALMAIVRSLLMYKMKFTGWVVYVWITLSAFINLCLADAVTDLVPFCATVQFTFMAKKQDAVSLKRAQVVNSLIWGGYHIAHRTYVYLAFDVILVLIGIIRLKKGVED